jgi:2,4'-dihydroxyacetophenone dioxygenase
MSDAHPKIVQLPPEPHAAAIAEFGRHGAHVGISEAESPWIPYGDVASIRHLAFDVRTGSVANILWVKGGGRIGTHRHRGAVSAVTLEGSWAYYEYDWVARPGSFVYEMPGAAHTLYSDDPNGMKALFWINGAIDFFDDDGKFAETVDVFWFINHYVSHCRDQGLPLNPALFL